MPNDSAASGDAASLALWKQLFGAPLIQAAQTLIDGGGVSNVRVLQNGRVITGIAGTAQRVYVQLQSAGTPSIDGECSCNDHSPCVHVAAVVMAATHGAQESAAPRPPTITPPQRAVEGAAAQGAPTQHLRYGIEPHGAGDCQLTVWVTQTDAGTGNGPAQVRTHPFATRNSEGAREYPRYVDSQDRQILGALTGQLPDGQWRLTGTAGFALLQHAVASGRAFWKFPGSAVPLSTGVALHTGPARRVPFAWLALPNGDQHLGVDATQTLDFVLGLEPVV